MKWNHKKSFIVIAVFWLIILLGMIGAKEFTMVTGKEVLLETEPVDPRDLFRGDYVILQYPISEIPNLMSYHAGDTIYVNLEYEEPYWKYASVSDKRDPKPDQVAIKGKITNQRWGSGLRVEYGIESYFVPEGKGRHIERLRNQRGEEKVDVLVVVDRFGNAVIKDLLIDSKPVDFRDIEKEDATIW